MVRDIWEICPFGNTINVCSVTGKTLKQMIRNNIKQRITENPQDTPDFLVVSGMIIMVDFAKAKEGKDEFLVSVKVGGEEVSDVQNYTISTNNYVAGQFKKFFGEVEEPVKFTDTNLIDRDILLEQVEKVKVINNVVEKRIIDISK
jgi:2',3'-cyclic-nucleotide 2'-phosphodiesterase (5'-nucleotidase family)